FGGSSSHYTYMELITEVENGEVVSVAGWEVVSQQTIGAKTFVKLSQDGVERWFDWTQDNDTPVLKDALSVTQQVGAQTLYNGEPKENGRFYQVGHMSKIIVNGEEVAKTGPVGPF